MGPEHESREKILSMVISFNSVHKNVYRIRFQERRGRELRGFLRRSNFSSPRTESAGAITGRRCPHSGEGEDFLTRQPSFFFTKMAITRKRKVEKSS